MRKPEKAGPVGRGILPNRKPHFAAGKNGSAQFLFIYEIMP